MPEYQLALENWSNSSSQLLGRERRQHNSLSGIWPGVVIATPFSAAGILDLPMHVRQARVGPMTRAQY
jgi:hypothetical protein